MERDGHGKFAPKQNSLSNAIGLRVSKDLEPSLDRLSEEYGLKRTVLCRALVEGLLQPERADVMKEILIAFQKEQSA